MTEPDLTRFTASDYVPDMHQSLTDVVQHASQMHCLVSKPHYFRADVQETYATQHVEL